MENLFPQCFNLALSPRVVKTQDFVVKEQPFTMQSWVETTLQENTFENIVGKGENAGNHHFLLYRTMFSTPNSFLNDKI